MSNTINNLLTNEKTTNINSSSSTEQTVKDKPSLFDSLLTTTSPTQESEVKSDSKVEEVEDPKNKIDVNKIVETEEIKSTENKTENKIDIEEKIENKEVKVSGTVTSLLDRLVIEAKSDIKVINKEEVDKLNKIDNSLLTTTSPTQESEVKSDSKVEEVEDPKNKIDVNKTDNLLLEVVEEKKEGLVTNKEETKIVEVKEKLTTTINNNGIQSLNTQTTTVESIVVSLPLKENIEKEILNNSNNLLDNDSEVLNIEDNINLVEEDTTNKSEITNVKKDEKLSLMDQLILKNSEKISIDNINSNAPLKELVPKDLITSIYLGSQKNLMNNQSLFNKNEAVSLLKEGTSIQAVKTSAEMLELGLEDINVEQTVEVEKIEVKKTNIDMVDRKNLIDNILSQKNVRSEEIKGLITKSVEASNALIENSITLADDVNININSPLSYNIQSRIIGAKQQMSTMMSDIAKQMYENYKPPVTVFRINLNPLELGSIAIMMKSDKNNGLSISMNVSNNTTLEALMENQNVLRNSLNKTFDENTRFNLDFNSSNQNSNNQSSNNQNQQNNNGRFEQQMDTQSVLQLKEENKDREEKSIDYM